MNTQTILLILILGKSFGSIAQCKEWDWPENRKAAEENLALLQDAVNFKKYQQAGKPLKWLITENPRIHSNVYVHGINAYDALANREKNPVKKKVYVDSLLTLYNLRLANCNDAPNVQWRMASAAFKYLINGPEAGRVLPIMDTVLYRYPSTCSDGLLLSYMQTIVINNQKFKVPDQDGVLSRYDLVVEELNRRLKQFEKDGTRKAKLNKIRKDIDDWLFRVVKPDCDFVRQNLAPRFQQNPGDISLAKKIFAYMLQGGCADDPLWLKSAEAVFGNEKDFGLAKNIALRYLSIKDEASAKKYLGEAIALSESRKDSADVIYYIGVIETGTNKPAARDYFLQALKLDPQRKDAAERIGDLYYGSFEECAGKKMEFEDRAVYLAAHKWYARAGNVSKMKLAQQSFPSREEIFVYSHKKGDRFHVGCWINEDVVLQTRD